MKIDDFFTGVEHLFCENFLFYIKFYKKGIVFRFLIYTQDLSSLIYYKNRSLYICMERLSTKEGLRSVVQGLLIPLNMYTRVCILLVSHQLVSDIVSILIQQK